MYIYNVKNLALIYHASSMKPTTNLRTSALLSCMKAITSYGKKAGITCTQYSINLDRLDTEYGLLRGKRREEYIHSYVNCCLTYIKEAVQ